ncbi:hypothetical protein AAC387_Pa07g1794 [Persea americana]
MSWPLCAAHELAASHQQLLATVAQLLASINLQVGQGKSSMVAGGEFWPLCIIEWPAAWWLVGRGKLTAGHVEVLAARIKMG